MNATLRALCASDCMSDLGYLGVALALYGCLGVAGLDADWRCLIVGLYVVATKYGVDMVQRRQTQDTQQAWMTILRAMRTSMTAAPKAKGTEHPAPQNSNKRGH